MTDDRPPPHTMTQAAGQVATDVVGSLKGNPILLILVLFNAAFIALVHFTAKDNRERQAATIEHLIGNQQKMQELLSRCTAGGRSDIVIPPLPSVPL